MIQGMKWYLQLPGQRKVVAPTAVGGKGDYGVKTQA